MLVPITALMVLILLSVTFQAQPVQGQRGIGPLAEHLQKAYGEDWPHYAPWVHSEIKIADNVVAYNLRGVDLGYNIFPKAHARGALVAYATRDNKLGLAFINTTGELFKLYECPIASPPKHREGLDLGYITIKENNKVSRIVLVVWGTDKKLYMLRAELGAYQQPGNVNFPAIVRVSDIIGIDLPPGYRDAKQVKVLTLNDEFVVFFTAQRENKPTEEYGYDLFYALVSPDGTVKVGPKDLGFQDVMAFQVKILKGLEGSSNLIGLAFMGRWRQYGAGVWWATIKLERNSLKIIKITLISDPSFQIPSVDRALIDFDYYPIESSNGEKFYSVLVVWNDCRCPKVIFDRIRKLVPIAEFVYIKNKTWVLYGQRLKVYGDGRVELYSNDGKIEKSPKNFPVAYLVLSTRTRTETVTGEIVESWETTFGKIDSVTLYTTHGIDKNGNRLEYFVVDVSIDTINDYVSRWLFYAVYGEFELKNTYGFDVLSVPIPVEPSSSMKLGTEVDEVIYKVLISKFGTRQTKQSWVAYPVLNDKGSDIIPKNQPSPEGLIYLYDTIQFNETYATKTLMVHKDQIDVKVVPISSGVIMEGFIDTNGTKSALFIMPNITIVGPVKYIYLDYDNNGTLSKFIYPLDPYTVLKIKPIRIEDHPGAQVGPIVYDFNNQNTLKDIYLEVTYTTDFSDKIPHGSILVDIFKPTWNGEFILESPLVGYAIHNENKVKAPIVKTNKNKVYAIVKMEYNKNKVQVEFLPPITIVLNNFLNDIKEIMKSKTINKEIIKKAVTDALNELNELKQQQLLQSSTGTSMIKGIEDELKKLKEEIDKEKKEKTTKLVMMINKILRNLKQLVEGTYHVFVIYHPIVSSNEQNINLEELSKKFNNYLHNINLVIQSYQNLMDEVLYEDDSILKILNMRDEKFYGMLYDTISDIEDVKEYLNNYVINPKELINKLDNLQYDLNKVIDTINPEQIEYKINDIIKKLDNLTNDLENIIENIKFDNLLVKNYPEINIIKCKVNYIVEIKSKLKDKVKELKRLSDDYQILKDKIEKIESNNDYAYDQEFISELMGVLNDLEYILSRSLQDLYNTLVNLNVKLKDFKSGNIINVISNTVNDEDLIEIMIKDTNEFAYVGVTSWVPIVVKCEVPTIELTRSGVIMKPKTSVTKVPVVIPPYNQPVSKSSSSKFKNQQQQGNLKRTVPRQSNQYTHSVPLLPIVPYRRALSRPKFRRRSCTRKVR